ncbi:MAG: GntR family transcriptional regulator [Spirochaetes bacterium]|nr:MAG: GntR family transcriptional regulator [Spirochaetota bacterium]
MKKIITLSMRDQIYEALREAILKNDYPPGAVLQIDRIAEEFGVSATPVREALVRLRGDGLVSLVPNRGAQVVEIRKEDIFNVWEMRKLLEPYAALRSAKVIPLSEVRALKADIEAMRAAQFDNEKYIASDARLHELLYIFLTNAELKDTIRRIHQMSIRIRYFPENATAMHEQVVLEVIGEHLAILEAAESRDESALEKLVRRHLENGERRVLSALGSP